MHTPSAPARRRGLLTRLLITSTLIATMLAFSTSAVSAAEVRDITLPVPLDSVGSYGEGVYWSDTYGACRSGCSRSHQGVDMLGPKLTPLLAARDGYVSWMRHDSGRGNNLVITDDEGWSYHYIHINNDSPGTDDGANPIEWAFSPAIAEAWQNGTWQGLRVEEGDLVAYMGDSGNAESCCSHLHFEIVNPDGANINPTPSVDAALAAAPLMSIEVAPELLGGYSTFTALVTDVFETLRGTRPTVAEAEAFATALETEGLAGALEPFVTDSSVGAQVDRLYVAFFLRLPDQGGYEYWIDTAADGSSLEEIAEYFALGEEFVNRYGNKDFGAFLDQLYSDVLFRAPDEDGKQYWLDQLESGNVTRGTIVVYFTEGAELRNATSFRSEVVALTSLMEKRMPTDTEIEQWVELRASTSFADAAQQLVFG